MYCLSQCIPTDVCQGLSTGQSDDDCPSLVIPLVIACLVTALVVTIVAVITCLVVVACFRKKMAKGNGKTSGSYPMDNKGNLYNN